jgi:hypothetical protein
MKSVFAPFAVLALLVTAQFANGQSTASTTWKEKDEFHKVMAQTFHPAEEGNFEPIRTRSQEMFDKANAWLNSTPPAEFNKPQIRETLQKLVRQSRELNAKIRNQKPTDEEIKTDLTAMHDTFHEIVGMCKPGDHDHNHEGHEGHNHK